MAESQEFPNRVTLLDLSTRELKQWELIRWVESLVAWRTSGLRVIDSDVDSTASELTHD